MMAGHILVLVGHRLPDNCVFGKNCLEAQNDDNALNYKEIVLPFPFLDFSCWQRPSAPFFACMCL